MRGTSKESYNLPCNIGDVSRSPVFRQPIFSCSQLSVCSPCLLTLSAHPVCSPAVVFHTGVFGEALFRQCDDPLPPAFLRAAVLSLARHEPEPDAQGGGCPRQTRPGRASGKERKIPLMTP